MSDPVWAMLVRKSDGAVAGRLLEISAGRGIPHPTDPLRQLASPAEIGWEDDEWLLAVVERFDPPSAKRRVGLPSYAYADGVVTETFDVEDVRPMVRKSTVQARLIDAGKMEAAYAALTSNPVYFARWFAPDHPMVYCDDPDALVLLAAIGADAETIMASEEV